MYTRRILALTFAIVILISATGYEPCRAAIRGYAELSVAAGAVIHFRVKSSADSFKVSWYQFGAPSLSRDAPASESDSESQPGTPSTLDIGDDAMIEYTGYRMSLGRLSEQGPFAVVPQPVDADDAYMSGTNWLVSCSLEIPPDWPSDFYFAKLTDNRGSYTWVPVIIRSASPGTQARIAVISATNTWQAYNTYGGASFYTCERPSCTEFSSFVSYDRPLGGSAPTPTGHLSGIEHFVLNFLKNNGLAYEQLTDLDLHASAETALLENYSVLILAGHSEYWTAEMIQALESFLDNGGRLINLSGNTMFWKVRFDGSRMEKVGRWRNLIPGGEFGVLGAGFNGGGHDPACAGFRVLRGHWIFSETGLQEGNVFAAEGINSDASGCPDGSGGASGWEFDVIGPGSPPPCGDGVWDDCLELLAKGANENYDGQEEGADMYLYHRGRGGYIFGAPSITLTGSLVVDTSLQRVILNVIEAFLSDSVTPAAVSCCVLDRGDLNGDGYDAGIMDLTSLVDFLFRGKSESGWCPREADVNGDNVPANLLDLTFLVDYLFRGGPAPGPC